MLLIELVIGETRVFRMSHPHRVQGFELHGGL